MLFWLLWQLDVDIVNTVLVVADVVAVVVVAAGIAIACAVGISIACSLLSVAIAIAN